MVGTCKLCLTEGVTLRNSHGIPAAVYKALRGDAKLGNPASYLLTPNGPVQTSKQDTAPSLCDGCEQKFSVGGERWVLSNSLRQDGSFVLASALGARAPDYANPQNTSTKVYLAANIPEVNITALTYFAVSMF